MLQDVHSNIVQQKLAKKHPHMIEGVGGADAGLPAFLCGLGDSTESANERKTVQINKKKPQRYNHVRGKVMKNERRKSKRTDSLYS